MKLTTQQINHAISRLNQIAKIKLEAAMKKHGPEPEYTPATFAQRCDMIRAGKAKLRPQAALSSYTYLEGAYEYPEEAKRMAAHNVKTKKWRALYDAAEAAIAKEKQGVIDKIILSGDGSEALKAIEAFAKTK